VCSWHIATECNFDYKTVDAALAESAKDIQVSGQQIVKNARALEFYMDVFGDSDKLRKATMGIFWSGMAKVMARIKKIDNVEKQRAAVLALKGHKQGEYNKVLDTLEVPKARKKDAPSKKYTIDQIQKVLEDTLGLNKAQIKKAVKGFATIA